MQSQLGGSIGASFDPEFDPADIESIVAATSVSIHPDNLANPVSYKNPDIGVLTLEHPINGVQPVELPAEGAADQLQDSAPLTTIGYGFTRDCDTNLGHCEIDYDPVRRSASETLISVSRWDLTVGQNPNAHGTGGICLGDSGGPHLLAGTNPAVAVTTAFFEQGVLVHQPRHPAGTTPTALAFLRSFLPGQH